MAFHHLAGVTTPGAPDEIIDWFSTFETWITGTVGWTVASGAGTTDLYITSAGEAGGLTMLYVHAWRGSGPDINKVFLEVCDDDVPTHQTTRGGYVDSGGVQFAYFMSADKDAIVIVWKAGAGYRMLYGGLVYPWALTVPDETYRSIAARDIRNATILRRFDDLWDQDDLLYYNLYLSGARFDPDDGSLPIGGLYFGDHADVAGQLKHISCEITEPAANPEDTLPTGQPGATTEWIILMDDNSRKFALRTGGVLPTGAGDGTFSHTSGTAPSVADFFNALDNHLSAHGWTVTDISGVTGRPHDRECFSVGESGADVIWARVQIGTIPTSRITITVADSAYGTPGRHETSMEVGKVVAADFPTQYYITADKDCFIFTINDGGLYESMWLGKLSPVAPNLSEPSFMNVGAFLNNSGHILLAHDGVWNQVLGTQLQGDGAHCTNCNPNNYDGITHIVWPHLSTHLVGIMAGTPKYYFATHGGVAVNDTITVAGRRYRVFMSAAQTWAMRDV